jgi:hypothetical protein
MSVASDVWADDELTAERPERCWDRSHDRTSTKEFAMRLAVWVLVALPLASASVAAAGDISGRWTIEGDVQGNAVNLNCQVQQSADAKIAGKCDLNGTDKTEIAGAVKDTSIKFAFTVGEYTLTYTGVVQGDTITGDIEVAGASGRFTAKRAK